MIIRSPAPHFPIGLEDPLRSQVLLTSVQPDKSSHVSRNHVLKIVNRKFILSSFGAPFSLKSALITNRFGF